MQFWYEVIVASAVNTTITEKETANIQSTDALITCALQEVNQQGTNGQATIAITEYVQNGTPHEGSWPVVNGNGITSVTFTLTVTNAKAVGTGLILAINQ
jgi:hypothetical protein